MKESRQCRGRRIQAFVDHIPTMLATCARLHEELYSAQECLIRAVERDVELSDASQRASVAHCRRHYAYWGRADVGGDRRLLRAHLRRSTEPVITSTYRRFCAARFGAWRYTPGGEQTAARVEAVDGRSEPASHRVIHAASTELESLDRETRLVAGWLVEVEGYSMLLLTCEFEPRAARKLLRAAERGCWGDGRCHRGRDYEADVLALLFEPMCVDLERSPDDAFGKHGRTFLSPIVRGWGWGVSAMKLTSAFQERLTERGLSHRGESMPWHLAVALAETAADIDAMLDELDDIRRETIREKFEPQHPLGPHTMETLFSSGELLEMAGLTSEGALREDDDYLELTLEQVGLASGEFRRCGVDAGSTLEEALRHSSSLSQCALDELGDAIQLARSRVRWATLLRQWADGECPWARPPALEELLVGVSRLFRSSLWDRPITELAEPVTGTWRRLERAFIDHGFRGSRLRVADLYELGAVLDELPGVGPRTLENAARGLVTTLLDWPRGPLWRPAETSTTHQ